MFPRRLLIACCTCCLAALAAGEAPQVIASQVKWAAGDYTLAQALDHLSVGGNTTVVTLGTSDHRTEALAAFDGTYWEGVLAICRSYGLTLATPTRRAALAADPQVGLEVAIAEGRVMHNGQVQACRFGPTVLVPSVPGQPAIAATPSGPVLFEVVEVRYQEARRLRGSSTWVEIYVRLHAEPRIFREEVQRVHLAWSAASCGDRQLTLGIPDDYLSGHFARQDTNQRRQAVRLAVMRAGGRNVHSPQNQPIDETVACNRIDIRGLKPGDQELTVTGSVTLAMVHPWYHELELDTDKETSFKVDGEEYEVGLYSKLADDDNSRPQDQSCSLILYHRGEQRLADNPVVEVRNARGQLLQHWGGGQRGTDRRQTHHFRFRMVKVGHHTVQLAGTHRRGETQLAVTGRVELP